MGTCGLAKACSARRILFAKSVIPIRNLSQLRAPRPPTASKQFPDLKHIRQNVDQYSQNCLKRDYKDHAGYPAEIARLAKDSQLAAADVPVLSKKIKGLQGSSQHRTSHRTGRSHPMEGSEQLHRKQVF